MSIRDIIEAAKAVPGAWFTLGRWTGDINISGIPEADRVFMHRVCDPEHVALMEAVCEAEDNGTDAELTAAGEALQTYRKERGL